MNVLDRDVKFRYQLLDRMRLDVEYCTRLIRNAKEENRNEDYTFILSNHLWGGSEDHFKTMSDILSSFSEEEQPEWYSLQQLNHDKAKLEELVEMSLG
ncbi:LPD11 domain-containing protein [Enterococcus thailandicus]|uniref:LPD11 domain-containing protein n=1 Tax=Enterococcus thailandicus TaxID=417368 RepID=UPI0035D765D1